MDSQRSTLISVGVLWVLLTLVGCAGQPLQPTPAPQADSQKTTPEYEPVLVTLDRSQLSVTSFSESVALYGLQELEVHYEVAVDNPFDPAEIDLRAVFTAQDGDQSIVPDFWYQDFDPQTLQPVGEPSWKVRFTPTQPGPWIAYLMLDGDHLSETVTFEVTPSEANGFVRIDPRNPRYFVYDSGVPYFPIGLNLGWSRGDVLADYERWLDRLSENGGSVARVWMASWSFLIEWDDTGLGNYDKRMQQAWLLDQVFGMAEERGVAIMLVLNNHGAFSTSVNPEWEDNPYNLANGGPLVSPAGFVSDETAKAYFRQRLRYVAAALGLFPSLFAWEWWNEVNWTPILDSDLAPWIEEMSAVLDEYDPNDHLTTNSYSDGRRSDIWSLPEVDFAQQHDYAGRDPADNYPLDREILANHAGEKPAVFGELGYSAGDDSNNAGLDSVHLHNGLWAAPFSGYASTAMYWWWDVFVDPMDQWGQFGAIAEFLRDEDLAELTPGQATLSSEGASALTLQSDDRALVWIRSDAYDVEAARDAFTAAVIDAIKSKTKLTNWTYEAPLLEGMTVTVDGLGDGVYTLRWFNPQSAEWLEPVPIEVNNGEVVMAITPFSADWAAKIVAQPAAGE